MKLVVIQYRSSSLQAWASASYTAFASNATTAPDSGSAARVCCSCGSVTAPGRHPQQISRSSAPARLQARGTITRRLPHCITFRRGATDPLLGGGRRRKTLPPCLPRLISKAQRNRKRVLLCSLLRRTDASDSTIFLAPSNRYSIRRTHCMRTLRIQNVLLDPSTAVA